MSSLTLVTGAAPGQVGAVGFKVVQLLRAAGVPVRAFVHKMDERTHQLTALGAEVVCGDLTDPLAVSQALKGCSRVCFIMAVNASYLQTALTVTAVARERRVQLLVNLSQMTVSQMSTTSTTDSNQQRCHWLAEQVMNWSGLPVAHVRATAFAEHPFFTTMAAETIKAAGELRLPFGASRTSPIAALDVARCVAAVLTGAPAQHAGNVYEITGPESLDVDGLAAAYSNALGRPVKAVHGLSLEEWTAQQLVPAHMPPYLEQHIHTMADLHGKGAYERHTNTVAQLTGKPAAAFGQWVADHKDMFQ